MKYLELNTDEAKGLFTQTARVYEEESQLTDFWFRRMLRPEFSFDGTFQAVSGTNSRVMADIISTQSSLPIKSRGAIKAYSGKIPKMGLKYVLDEDDITMLDGFSQVPGMENQVIQKIYNDVNECIMGIERTNEYNLLSLLSGEAFLAKDDTLMSENQAVRVSYDINETDSGLDFDTATAAQLRKAINGAIKESKKKKRARYVLMSDNTFDALAASKLADEVYAQVIRVKDAPSPTPEQFKDAFKAVFGVEIEVIDTILEQENVEGVKTEVKPFKDNVMTFVPSLDLGRLVWAKTGEHNIKYQSKCAVYANVNTYTLVSQHSEIEPLEFYTRGQARALPVLDEIENMYFLKFK